GRAWGDPCSDVAAGEGMIVALCNIKYTATPRRTGDVSRRVEPPTRQLIPDRGGGDPRFRPVAPAGDPGLVAASADGAWVFPKPGHVSGLSGRGVCAPRRKDARRPDPLPPRVTH